MHPSGRFLYGSNRGHDTLAIFSIGEDGKLKPQGHASTEGKSPRNFCIDPTGAYLLAANQDTGNVVVFAIDQTSGELKLGAKVNVIDGRLREILGHELKLLE